MGGDGGILARQRPKERPKKLIRGAVRAARYGEPAPPPLRLAQMCGAFHLPDAGGVHDQEFATFNAMRTLDNVYSVVQAVMNMKGKQIHQMNMHQRRVVRFLLDLGVYDG